MENGNTGNGTSLIFEKARAEDIGAIRPLWEKLNEHHSHLSRHFGDEFGRRAFEPRKRELLGKADAGQLRIELVKTEDNGPPVAYCISTLDGDGVGEIDSIYVEENLRGCGIGTKLMKNALAWLDDHGAISKIVSVADGNDEALAFYARFGFLPRRHVLQMKGQCSLETR